jgi:hypothetical protein
MRKTLILAAFATALSLGTGAAMANASLSAKNQEMTSSQAAAQAAGDYRAAMRSDAPTWNAAGNGMVGGFDAN